MFKAATSTGAACKRPGNLTRPFEVAGGPLLGTEIGMKDGFALHTRSLRHPRIACCPLERIQGEAVDLILNQRPPLGGSKLFLGARRLRDHSSNLWAYIEELLTDKGTQAPKLMSHQTSGRKIHIRNLGHVGRHGLSSHHHFFLVYTCRVTNPSAGMSWCRRQRRKTTRTNKNRPSALQ